MDSEDIEKKTFKELIKEFNSMYGLDVNDNPTLPTLERLKNFKSILSEEVEEINDIIENYENSLNENQELEKEKEMELMTDISDVLGDLVVYIRSEATKYGIELEKTLDIIMQSNFSKLGEDGKPIYDERGKVMKGPNYWKPEPKIQKLLKDNSE
jgi:predicted HAD superfamily Cof-like phosphohydrolase|tara:strand:+ start:1317 stop:1781 length:465 start_codon:yes stop_codon:yes gene_type:complete